MSLDLGVDVVVSAVVALSRTPSSPRNEHVAERRLGDVPISYLRCLNARFRGARQAGQVIEEEAEEEDPG